MYFVNCKVASHLFTVCPWTVDQRLAAVSKVSSFFSVLCLQLSLCMEEVLLLMFTGRLSVSKTHKQKMVK